MVPTGQANNFWAAWTVSNSPNTTRNRLSTKGENDVSFASSFVMGQQYYSDCGPNGSGVNPAAGLHNASGRYARYRRKRLNPLRGAVVRVAATGRTRRRASTDTAPAPMVASSRNPKQYRMATSPPLPPIASGYGQNPLGKCIQKYATAISPDTMNAAIRVNSPMVMSAPSTTSSRLAHQSGHVPTGIAVPNGNPNIFIVPRKKNRSPNTTRNAVSAGV